MGLDVVLLGAFHLESSGYRLRTGIHCREAQPIPSRSDAQRFIRDPDRLGCGVCIQPAGRWRIPQVRFSFYICRTSASSFRLFHGGPVVPLRGAAFLAVLWCIFFVSCNSFPGCGQGQHEFRLFQDSIQPA